MTNRGSVLILSLWILTLLALVSAGLAHALGVDARLASARWDEIRLARAAHSAVLLAGEALRRASATGAWRDAPALFKDRPLPDGAAATFARREGERVFYGAEDEAARINVNTAPADVLEALFPGAPEAAASLQDWRDADDAPRPGGSEGAEGGVLPRNGPLQSVEELLLVRGVTPEQFKRVEPWVTVHGAGRVNANTAAEDVLLMLGLEPGAARRILALRRGEDGVEGTDDDTLFPGMNALVEAVQRSGGLAPAEQASFQRALQRNLLGVEPGPFRLRFEVRLDPAGPRREFQAVVSKSWPPRILSWREPS